MHNGYLCGVSVVWYARCMFVCVVCVHMCLLCVYMWCVYVVWTRSRVRVQGRACQAWALGPGARAISVCTEQLVGTLS